jgi:hypothetical protein
MHPGSACLTQPEATLSIPGKKRTEKWQLPSGPLWLHSSRKRLAGVRTGRRVAGPRKRMQQPGGLRKPVAPGDCPGLREKAKVSQAHLLVALPNLGRERAASAQHSAQDSQCPPSTSP